jgi:hypothetical protein
MVAAAQPAHGFEMFSMTPVKGTAATMRDQVSHIGSSRFHKGSGELLSSAFDTRAPDSIHVPRQNHFSQSHVTSLCSKPAKPNGYSWIGLALCAGLMGALWTSGAFAAQEIELPERFWLGKLKTQERLREREILVSVRTESGRLDPKADRLLMSGVGWVRQTPQVVFETAKNFEVLPSVSDHFREVKYDKKANRLFIISQALGYQARMLFQLRLDETNRSIQFRVIDGHFLGLRGEISMRAAQDLNSRPYRDKTEMTVLMAHEARELPVPKILIGFALEIVAKNVAQKMRRYLESQTEPSERAAQSKQLEGKIN